MKHIPKSRAFGRRLRRDQSGAAAIEFGLMASMLVTLLIPTFDLGMGAYTKMRVQDAAEAGAQYAQGNAYSSGAITTAAQSATSLGTHVSVTATNVCYCVNALSQLTPPSGDATPPAPPCTPNSCSDGSTPGTYVTVATSTNYAPLVSFSVPGLSIASTITLTGTAAVRTN